MPAPAANQILVATEASAVSAGTELAVYTGTHQWLKDPNLPDWKFPFRPGYSAAGTVVAVGSGGHRAGSRATGSVIPGNHASAELLTLGHERGRLWKLPADLDCGQGPPGPASPATAWGRPSGPASRWAGRRRCWASASSASSPCAACSPPGPIRSSASTPCACAARPPWPPAPTTSSTLAQGDVREQLSGCLGTRGAEIVADATGIPDAMPAAMALACDGGQVVVVGSPRGRAKEVNFYDDLHRRYIEVTGAHGNMLFEPAHTRLAGAWDINKAQNWLLATLAAGRLSLAGLVTHRIRPADLGDRLRGTPQEERGIPGSRCGLVSGGA